jgi:hypothetical protein
MTSGALGTPAGGTDGFLARYSTDGTQAWLTQLGTSGPEEVWGLAADAAGNPYVVGYSGGDFARPLAGDKDIVVARYDATGARTWADQLGTTTNDKGAAIAIDGAGNLFAAGFTDGDIGTNLGGWDGVLVRYALDGTRVWTRQFGTTQDDGADIFAEANLYLAARGGAAYVSGLTLGEPQGAAPYGSGDVFLATFDAEGAN